MQPPRLRLLHRLLQPLLRSLLLLHCSIKQLLCIVSAHLLLVLVLLLVLIVLFVILIFVLILVVLILGIGFGLLLLLLLQPLAKRKIIASLIVVWIVP